KEFELLQMMLLSQGKVFSREEFLDTIWGYDSFVDSRAIDVHIKNLRSKLGKDIIQTVKGIGYRIEKETN
ncbi:winged helix family transcriptional regulator, partial [Listeria monocytogenes]|nr:winged helix family transcriptional regulator [Listeria monocytogenes]